MRPANGLVMDVFKTMATGSASRCYFLRDRDSGLRAVIAIDDTTLGPAVGGIRTRAYETTEAALVDAIDLARAMTVKCALAGLAAGGGKAAVILHPAMDRGLAFEVLGARIEELGGLFRTAGDYGTTERDLEAVARTTKHVHLGGDELARAVGYGVVRSIEGCLDALGEPATLRGLRVAIQGCGAVGSATARELAKLGAELVLADADERAARALADELGARVVGKEQILFAEVDVLAPCALSRAIDDVAASELRARIICGAANNALAHRTTERILATRGVTFVPDVISSAGAVIDGIGRSHMGLDDRTPLLDRMRETARTCLCRARGEGALASDVAQWMAEERIARRD